MQFRKIADGSRRLFKALLIAAGGATVSLCATVDATPSTNRVAIGQQDDHAQGAVPRLNARYGQLPLAFEMNQGQTDARVDFLARGPGYGLFLTPGGALLSLLQAPNKSSTSVRAAAATAAATDAERTVPPATTTVVGMNLVGSNPHTAATGLAPLSGATNYLIGNDAGKWHTGIRNYSKIRYAAVYPGIDLVYYGNQQQLEYDFVVAPGADPSAIQLDFAGVDKVSVDAEGNLLLATAAGNVIQHKPVIYQTIGDQRRIVEGAYVVHGKRAAFQVADYDKTRTLTIDPTLAYLSYLGDSSPNEAFAMAVEADGSMYVAGYATSSAFPVVGAYQPKPAGGVDAFVTKISADGSSLAYSTFLGGSGDDHIFHLAVDTQGHAYVVGNTSSANFPTTSGVVQHDYAGGVLNTKQDLIDHGDGFVVKLSADGGSLIYATYLGGSGDDIAYGLAIDSAGNAYVTGETTSTDFPTRPGAYQPKPGVLNVVNNATNAAEVFVAKLSPDASALLYSTYLGVDADQAGYSIAVDAGGNAYVAGYTASSNFPTIAGAVQPAIGHTGANNGFVSKLNPAGSGLVYSTYLGDSLDAINSIALDAGGNAYVAGVSRSQHFPTTPGAYQTTHPNYLSATSAFVSKINAAGNKLIYSTYFHGSGNYADAGSGPTTGNPAASNVVLVDANGNAYLVGAAGSNGNPNLPVTPDAYQTTFGNGGNDPFVAEFNPSGSGLIYASYFGGNGGGRPWGAALAASGALYVAGSTAATNLSTTANAYQKKSPGTVSNYGVWSFVSEFIFPPAAGYTVGGSVSGLSVGSSVTLGLNGMAQTVPVGANGSFVFPAPLPDGSAYTATISAQPSGSPTQTCSVSNAGGSIAEANVTNIAVTCATAVANYTVGGSVNGLSGSGLVLSLNGGAQTLPVSAAGTFVFPIALANGAAYAVSVAMQPQSPAQSCTVSNGSGTLAGANVTNVAVTCATAPLTYIVTPSAGANGSISPPGAQTVAANTTATFAVVANNGYAATVGGTCGGVLNGTVYTTNPVTTNCTVAASFSAIARVSTTTTLTATPNPIQIGQPLTLLATVTASAPSPVSFMRALFAATSAAAAPTGTVTFKNGNTVVGSAVLSANGQAALTLSNLQTGTYSFTAVYSGDANDSASVSAAPVSVSVNPASSTLAVPAPAGTVWSWLAMCFGFVGIAAALRRRSV
ncbi:MAG: SBBP repeat-containing protein [Rudaea sp.]|uniref:DUF7948 domain-containing protein n=1 Tax=unclassified Rudaea TaxID=2627037 RepID=UPI0010F4D972|nr:MULTISPECIES: SBBP repeat-containing protein [unclassified Rudaea]MBN8888429.1 SBBP repeat-containing protein [Rudaea sp.]MBR0347536.1 SBBP repeat-containing protein [Rudaea sp.]